MKNEVQSKRFVQAVGCLPARLQNVVLHQNADFSTRCEELRLRAGQPIRAQMDGAERPLSELVVSAEDLRETVSRAARYSVHSFSDALAQGYLPLEGGHRLGVCGTAVLQSGVMTGIRVISSLNLRIARPQSGVADAILPQLLDGSTVHSTLILSPPGFGKTTVLRDLIYQLSERGFRVGVADERGELAAMRDGVPQFPVGAQTDVLDGCSKAVGALLLLKTMSPSVIALDEVTAPADVDAIAFAGHCGVRILATAHAADLQDLSKRPLYQNLLSLAVFERVVCIRKTGHERHYEVQKLGGVPHA